MSNSEAWEAWEAYLAEIDKIDPKDALETLRQYRHFREGWNRAVMWCTELLRGISFKQESESDVKQDRS